MPQSPVTLNFLKTFDIHLHFAPQVTLNHVVLVYDLTQSCDFILGQVPDTCIRVHLSLAQHLLASATPNSIDISQGNLYTLIAWQVNTCNACHSQASFHNQRTSKKPTHYLSLALLVLGISADDTYDASALDNLALFTTTLDRWSYFHFDELPFIPFTNNELH
jgi:hypothetical protein